MHFQNWTFDSCTLCVKYVHIVHFNRIVTLLVLYPGLCWNWWLRWCPLQRIIIPKVYTCMYSCVRILLNFIYIYYTPVYIFNFNPGLKIYYDSSFCQECCDFCLFPKHCMVCVKLVYVLKYIFNSVPCYSTNTSIQCNTAMLPSRTDYCISLVMVSVLFPKCIHHI